MNAIDLIVVLVAALVCAAFAPAAWCNLTRKYHWRRTIDRLDRSAWLRVVTDLRAGPK